MATGQKLIEQCKQHILDVMRSTPQCAPTGDGLGNREIEKRCEFELGLTDQNTYFTWSLLRRMAMDAQIEMIGPKGRTRYRLTGR